jgi:Ca2+-binding RTX toxin-like protein
MNRYRAKRFRIAFLVYVLILSISFISLDVTYTYSKVAYAVPIKGTPGSDNLSGTPADDSIQSNRGNDIIVGLAGNDIIESAQGNDIVNGSGRNWKR